MPGLIGILDDNRVGKFNIVCTPHRTRLSLVPDALLVKSFHPQRTYVFGGLDISPLFMAPESCVYRKSKTDMSNNVNFIVNQVKNLDIITWFTICDQLV